MQISVHHLHRQLPCGLSINRNQSHLDVMLFKPITKELSPTHLATYHTISNIYFVQIIVMRPLGLRELGSMLMVLTVSTELLHKSIKDFYNVLYISTL